MRRLGTATRSAMNFVLGDSMPRVIGKTRANLAFCALLILVSFSTPALSQSVTRTSGFTYDAVSGLLTQEVIEPNSSSLRLETDYVYDAFGHKTQVTVSGVDITTRSSSTVYDSKGQFVTTATNALSQSESWQYDQRFGLPTSHTGPSKPIFSLFATSSNAFRMTMLV
jgi:hypothetical protein